MPNRKEIVTAQVVWLMQVTGTVLVGIGAWGDYGVSGWVAAGVGCWLAALVYWALGRSDV